MGSILSTQSSVFQTPRQRLLEDSAQQSGAAGAEQAAGVGAGARPADAPATTQPVLDPTRMRSRIDGLIDGQVASGGLTGDQARVLKQVLGSGAGGAETGRADAASDDPGATISVADQAVASSSDQTVERQNPSEMLASFIRQLQIAQSRIASYASDGSSEGTKLTSSRLLDFNT